MTELVKARVETIRAGDRVRLPSGQLRRCLGATEHDDGTITIHHDSGSLIALARGERWPVERGRVAPGDREAGPAAPASQLFDMAGREEAGPPVSAGAPSQRLERPRAPAHAGAPSPISSSRVDALAGVLSGFRWAGRESFSKLTARQQTAARQVARSALENLSVVE